VAKADRLRRIEFTHATGRGTAAGGAVPALVSTVAGSTDAETVNGFRASGTPQPNTLLALGPDAKFPASVLPDATSSTPQNFPGGLRTAFMEVFRAEYGAGGSPWINAIDNWRGGGAKTGIRYEVLGTAGTDFALNSALMELWVNGASRFKVQQDGAVSAVSFNGLTGLASAVTTQAIGDAAVTGTSTLTARQDHRHAMPGFGSPAALAIGSASSNGTATTLPRSDHVHAMPAFATPAVGLGTAAAAGTATTLLRSDATIVAFDGTAPTTQAIGDAAAVGSAAVAARRDHRHAMPAFATPTVTLGTAAAAGTATTLLRSDATIVAFDGTAPTTITPNAAAATGSVAFAARRDHTHAIATAAPGANSVSLAASTEGTGNNFARAAHTHQLDVSIAPTWTGLHTWSQVATFNNRLDISGANPLRLGGDWSLNRSAANVAVLGTGNALQSTTFVTGFEGKGWSIDANGRAEFQDAYIRGSLYATTFTYKEINALNGYFMVTNVSPLADDLTAGQTTIDIEDPVLRGNTTDGNSYVVLQLLGAIPTSGGGPLVVQREEMRITSYVGTVTATNGKTGYRYNVNRAQNNTTAYAWKKKTAVVEWGRIGGSAANKGGWVTLVGGSTDVEGPYVRVSHRYGDNPTDYRVRVHFGQMFGVLGETLTTRWGFAVGNDLGAGAPGSGATFLAYDNANGLRIQNADLSLYNGAAQTVGIQSSGRARFGSNIGAVSTTALLVSPAGETYNSEALAAGALLLGDNSAGKPNLLWDPVTARLRLRHGTSAGVQVGDLNGVYGYAAQTFGVGVGTDANSSANLTIDPTNGFRIIRRDGAGVRTSVGQWATDGSITVGQIKGGRSHVLITDTGDIKLRTSVTDTTHRDRISLSAAGVLTINNSAANAVFTFDSSSGAEFTLPLTLGSGGGIYQGTGSFASPTTGLKVWNDAGVGRIAGFNEGTIQWTADTDGKLKAGAGAVTLDSTGILMASSSGVANTLGFGLRSDSSLVGRIWAFRSTLSATDDDLSIRRTRHDNANYYTQITIREGVVRLWDNGAVFRDAHIQLANTATAPLYAGGSSNVNSGLYFPGIAEVGVSADGTAIARFTASGLTVTGSTTVSGGLNLGSATGAAAGELRTSGNATLNAELVFTGTSATYVRPSAFTSNYQSVFKSYTNAAFSDTNGGGAITVHALDTAGSPVAGNGSINFYAYGLGSAGESGAHRWRTRSGAGAFTERMRLFSGGGLAIGTMTDPGAGGLFLSGNTVFGAAAAGAGKIRLPNNQGIYWRNAANNADFGIVFNTDNNFSFGAGIEMNNQSISNLSSLVTDTTNGTRIATASTQKLGFFGATPVTQPTVAAAASDLNTVITLANSLRTLVRDLGLAYS